MRSDTGKVKLRISFLLAVAVLASVCIVVAALVIRILTGSEPEDAPDTPHVTVLGTKSAVETDYGISGRGRLLQAFRYGTGKNVLVCTFAIHGFEDGFPRDGAALLALAEEFMDELEEQDDLIDDGDWSVWVLPCLNPDGLADGTSENGPGRCTVNGQGLDINRCFPVGWEPLTESRYYNGEEPLACPEAAALADFLETLPGEGENIHIDVHGWYGQTITSDGRDGRLFRAFRRDFPNNTWADCANGGGYLTAYTASLGYDACLFEFPAGSRSVEEFLDSDLDDRWIRSVLDLLAQTADPGSGYVFVGDTAADTSLLLAADGYGVDPDEPELVNVLEKKNDRYFVRDRSVYVAKEIMTPLNGLMSGYYAATGDKSVNVVAGWRSYDDQQRLWDKAVQKKGDAYASSYFSRPGESEHHTGLAVDLAVYHADTGLTEDFAPTGRYAWFADNAWRYGFVLRYSPAKVSVTRISAESWHYRYVGVAHAKYMWENDLCLEEYLTLLESEHPFDDEHLTVEAAGKTYEIYACPEHGAYVPAWGEYTVSRTNRGTVIVTVER